MALPQPREEEFARQRALDTYRIVDTLPEAAYDDIVRVAAVVCDAPIALISLIDRDRQWFKARVGVDIAETPRDEAVCDHAIRHPDELMEVADLARDPRFAELPSVSGTEGARFYAGMPLVTPGGAAIGTVCVVDHRPRTLDAAQREALAALARLTINLLEGRQRERVFARATLMPVAPAAAPANDEPQPAGYTVALLEVQGWAALVAERGERMAERALQDLDAALEDCLGIGTRDTLSRVTGSAEFVAVLHGDGAHATLACLRAAAAAFAEDSGLRVLSASADADAGEALERVYLRADEALSAEKSRLRPPTTGA